MASDGAGDIRPPRFYRHRRPNGAGKSTYLDRLAASGYSLGEVIGPDVIAAALSEPNATRDARAVSDMGFGEFRRQLAYKVQPSVSEVVVADRWFPSSKLCRLCGALNDGLMLQDRTFECNGCGHREDRALNAACNLERYPGLQGNPDACEHLSAGRSVRLTGETRADEAGISAYL